MQLNLVGRNFDLTEALKTHTNEKFKQLEKRHDHITLVNVALHTEHLAQIAEANIHANGHEFHAKASTEDMYQSIDEVVDKLITQLTKHQEKMIDSHR